MTSLLPRRYSKVRGHCVIADKAYDSNDLRQIIADDGMLAAILSQRSLIRTQTCRNDASPLKAHILTSSN
jgi:hypothetical protein